jgi:hypothetical protein
MNALQTRWETSVKELTEAEREQLRLLLPADLRKTIT